MSQFVRFLEWIPFMLAGFGNSSMPTILLNMELGPTEPTALAPETGLTDELRWLKDLKLGRRAACVELIARYQRPLYGFVRQLGHDDADAQDVLQDTFSTIWQTIGSLREPRALKTWIYRICTNVARAHYRRAQRDARHRSDGEPERHVQDSTAAKCLETNEQNAAVRRLVMMLGPSGREVVTLHYFAGLSLSECSDVLDLPLGTIKSRLARALAELKDLLIEAQVIERSADHVQDVKLR